MLPPWWSASAILLPVSRINGADHSLRPSINGSSTIGGRWRRKVPPAAKPSSVFIDRVGEEQLHAWVTDLPVEEGDPDGTDLYSGRIAG